MGIISLSATARTRTAYQGDALPKRTETLYLLERKPACPGPEEADG
jgi:hypothetical protein